MPWMENPWHPQFSWTTPSSSSQHFPQTLPFQASINATQKNAFLLVQQHVFFRCRDDNHGTNMGPSSAQIPEKQDIFAQPHRVEKLNEAKNLFGLKWCNLPDGFEIHKITCPQLPIMTRGNPHWGFCQKNRRHHHHHHRHHHHHHVNVNVFVLSCCLFAT